MTATRVVAAAVALCMTVTGLVPYAAAQQPSPPPAQGQPELFSEQVKVPTESERHRGLYTAAAVFVNTYHVPGRAITCGLGVLVGSGVLLITLGSGYRAWSAVVHEGCGGKWIVTGDDLRPAPDVAIVDWGRP